MTDDMVGWLWQQLDDIEAAAIGASFEESHPAGNHWAWGEVTVEHSDMEAPVVRGGFLRGNGGLSPDVSLVTVERYLAKEVNMTFPGEAFHAASKVHAEVAEHIVLHDPAAVLADIASKRAIIDWAIQYMEEDYAPWNEDCLKLMAQAYAHRPGYKDEWRP